MNVPDVYSLVSTPFCFHNLSTLWEILPWQRETYTGNFGRPMRGSKECPVRGVTSCGRVWRKGAVKRDLERRGLFSVVTLHQWTNLLNGELYWLRNLHRGWTVLAEKFILKLNCIGWEFTLSLNCIAYFLFVFWMTFDWARQNNFTNLNDLATAVQAYVTTGIVCVCVSACVHGMHLTLPPPPHHTPKLTYNIYIQTPATDCPDMWPLQLTGH